jgi:hypothetical protein
MVLEWLGVARGGRFSNSTSGHLYRLARQIHKHTGGLGCLTAEKRLLTARCIILAIFVCSVGVTIYNQIALQLAYRNVDYSNRTVMFLQVMGDRSWMMNVPGYFAFLGRVDRGRTLTRYCSPGGGLGLDGVVRDVIALPEHGVVCVD